MINVMYSNNVSRNTIPTDPNTTILDFLEQNGGYNNAQISLNGTHLLPGDLYKSFDELGIKDKCTLFEIIKTEGGA